MYGRFAELYDSLMFDVDYKKMAQFIKNVLKNHNITDGLILDLACGTGVLTRLLAKEGFDMTGVDLSGEMLSIAREKSDLGILYLEQDMTEFELYGTMRAICCSMDGFNYLTDPSELLRTLKLCHNYLDSDGVLIFDINSEYKLRNVLGNNTFVYDSEEVFYTWENEFDEESALCDFYLTFFVKNEEGTFIRINEEQTERAYKECEIDEMLQKAGFKICAKYDGYSENKAGKQSERVVYECIKMEEK